MAKRPRRRPTARAAPPAAGPRFLSETGEPTKPRIGGVTLGVDDLERSLAVIATASDCRRRASPRRRSQATRRIPPAPSGCFPWGAASSSPSIPGASLPGMQARPWAHRARPGSASATLPAAGTKSTASEGYAGRHGQRSPKPPTTGRGASARATSRTRTATSGKSSGIRRDRSAWAAARTSAAPGGHRGLTRAGSAGRP